MGKNGAQFGVFFFIVSGAGFWESSPPPISIFSWKIRPCLFRNTDADKHKDILHLVHMLNVNMFKWKNILLKPLKILKLKQSDKNVIIQYAKICSRGT